MGWKIRTFSAWPWSVQEIEDSLTKAARDCRCAIRGSQNRQQTKQSTVGPRRRKLSDQLSEKAERSAVGLQVVMDRAPRGQVMREHPPGDATANDVEDAVEDFPQIDGAGAPAGLGFGEQGTD